MNEKCQTKIDTTFSSILLDLEEHAKEDEIARRLFYSMYNAAVEYYMIRGKWDEMSAKEISRRNNEWTIKHDWFIAALNTLLEYLEKQTGGSTDLRSRLGNKRDRLGDFAMYVADIPKIINARMCICEACMWAVENPDALISIMKEKPDVNSVINTLMSTYEFDSNQACVIVDMRFRLLCSAEKQKTLVELNVIKARLELYNNQ